MFVVVVDLCICFGFAEVWAAFVCFSYYCVAGTLFDLLLFWSWLL